MFTGIVTHQGQVQSIDEGALQTQLWIQTPFSDLVLGESIAVDGVCLTVAAIEQKTMRMDVSPETLRCTIASRYAVGSTVHLERALRVQDRMGGHWVTGHVDQTAVVMAREVIDTCLSLAFAGILPENRRFLVPKGSITVNGVSLTINAVTAEGFRVMLVPHTLSQTTLATLKINHTVNIEFDQLVKTIDHLMAYHNEEVAHV